MHQNQIRFIPIDHLLQSQGGSLHNFYVYVGITFLKVRKYLRKDNRADVRRGSNANAALPVGLNIAELLIEAPLQRQNIARVLNIVFPCIGQGQTFGVALKQTNLELLFCAGQKQA